MGARQRSADYMLWREEVANRSKHWVRAVTACNSRCTFCLDTDTPRNVYLPEEEVKAELRRGREELNAWKVIISGGEASLHPKFFEFLKYAKEIGYGRVQTVTNGYMYGDKDFYDKAIDAGLEEITYSLHGHTAELHDRLTQTPGAFKRIMKSIIRSVRDPRVIVSVDTVINKQNVAVLDKIMELAISVGVTEFDLLHVIPQAAAFENRDELFYDPADYLPVLRKVFELTRHPRFVIWTNRFPVPFLEDLEDLIQDPHKMLDEVNGRRFHVRKYLDVGEPLNCREPERCTHCFIEPFCTTMERTMAAMNAESWNVWWIGSKGETEFEIPAPLPYGATMLGVEVETLGELASFGAPADTGWYIRTPSTEALSAGVVGSEPSVLVADQAEQLDVWLNQPLPKNVLIEISLNTKTAAWMLENRATLEANDGRVRINQPTHEHMKVAVENDVRDPRAFFEELKLNIPTSGLPACIVPGTTLIEGTQVLKSSLFDGSTGRVKIRDLASYHVAEHYRSKSVRCRDCVVNDRCEGQHINMIRDQGLKLLTPLTTGEWATEAERQLKERWPVPPRRIGVGMDKQDAPVSLPGFDQPSEVVEDPLAVIERKRAERKERMKARAARSAAAKKKKDGESGVPPTHA